MKRYLIALTLINALMTSWSVAGPSSTGDIHNQDSSAVSACKKILSPSEQATARAYQRWQSVTTENPDLPYFALGFTHRLDGFTSRMQRKMGHDVLSYGTFTQEVLHPDQVRRFIKLRVSVGYNLSATFNRIIAEYPGRKVILFNLDELDLEIFRRYLKTGHGLGIDATNAELSAILYNQQVFDHVRWFKGGRELEFDEIRALFLQFNPDLFI